MPKKHQSEWATYSVGNPPSDSSEQRADCFPLETISHVSHVSDAFRIFEDKKIRAGLVGDESKLKTTRSSVTWLSPNKWVNGSFYGNIRFAFDWREVVDGKKFYWVEAMDYSPVAYRILITGDKPSLDLERYRPEEGNGPLYYDFKHDKWYCNIDNLTGEFMLDEDLSLEKCKTVAFENHHDRICKRKGSRCEQLGRERYGAGASLLSRLIGQGALEEPLRRLFLHKRRLHPDAESAWGNIVRSFCRVETNGIVTHKSDAASPIVKAMLDRYGTRRKIKQLGSLFRSSEELELTLRECVAKAFGIPVENVTDSEDES
jgi:hypothetical protein